MAIRKISFAQDEYYHIYNRGNSKQKIFLNDDDYKHFVECLFVCNTKKNFKFRDDISSLKINAFDFVRGRPIVSICAWVLMPNHFHIYLRINPHMSDMWEKENKNAISEFMRKLSTAYVKYFNTKYKHTGSLFEGPFKSIHVENDNQAKYLFSYIHLNPLKLIDPKWREDGITNVVNSLDFLSSYKWSSYLDYLNKNRQENKILDLDNIPGYFSNIEDFKKEIFFWLDCKER